MNTILCLNREFRSDLEWWYQLAAVWNGVSILSPVKTLAPEGLVISDASGSWGCGAFHEQHWFQLQWDHSTKELLQILILSAIWSKDWAGNMAVVHILRTRHKGTSVMHQISNSCTMGF